MSEHFIVRCRHCDRVIGQCRCPAKDKLIKYDVCDVCKTLHPLEGKEPQEQATSSTQKSLSVLLDEIEERAEKTPSGPWRFKQYWGPYNWQGAIMHDTKGAYNLTLLSLETCTPEKDAVGEFIAYARTDVPALVKALRRALLELHPVMHRKAEHDIAALLNQGRTTQ